VSRNGGIRWKNTHCYGPGQPWVNVSTVLMEEHVRARSQDLRAHSQQPITQLTVLPMYSVYLLPMSRAVQDLQTSASVLFV
jgi:hypothetical protein